MSIEFQVATILAMATRNTEKCQYIATIPLKFVDQHAYTMQA